MTTWTGQAEVKDGTIRVVLPCDLPPGPVEIEVRVRDWRGMEARPDWNQLYGLGKEIWQGVDAKEYLRQLREDRELPS